MFSRRLLMQRGGSVLSPDRVVPLSSAGHGGWLEVNGPQAAEYDGKLFWTYVIDGGDVAVAQRDLTTGVTSETIIQGSVDDDIHVSPSIHVRSSDGRVVVFYNGHESAELWMWVSTDPGDIGAGSITNLDSQLGAEGYTYTTCIKLEDAYYLFFRCIASGTKWAYSVSTDEMATWSGAATLYFNTSHNRSYLKMSGGGDRVDFLALPEHANDGVGLAEHFYLTDSGGTPSFFNSSGVSLSRPITQGSATTIHASIRAGLGDILFSGGTPYVLYSVGVSLGDTRMRWGRHVGSWDTHEVTDDAQSMFGYLPGGAAFLSPTELLVSKDVSGTMQMYRFTTSDAGSTWHGTQLTDESDDNLFPKPVHSGTSLRGVALTGSIDASADPWSFGVTGFR